MLINLYQKYKKTYFSSPTQRLEFIQYHNLVRVAIHGDCRSEIDSICSTLDGRWFMIDMYDCFEDTPNYLNDKLIDIGISQSELSLAYAPLYKSLNQKLGFLQLEDNLQRRYKSSCHDNSKISILNFTSFLDPGVLGVFKDGRLTIHSVLKHTMDSDWFTTKEDYEEKINQCLKSRKFMLIEDFLKDGTNDQLLVKIVSLLRSDIVDYPLELQTSFEKVLSKIDQLKSKLEFRFSFDHL